MAGTARGGAKGRAGRGGSEKQANALAQRGCGGVFSCLRLQATSTSKISSRSKGCLARRAPEISPPTHTTRLPANTAQSWICRVFDAPNTTRTSDHAMCVWPPHRNIAPPTTSASQASPLRVNTRSSLALGFLMLALISIMVVLGMAGNELSKEPFVSDKDDVSNVTYAKTADEDVVNAKVHYSYFIRLRHNTCANTSTHSHTSTACPRIHAHKLASIQVHKCTSEHASTSSDIQSTILLAA